GDDLARAEVAPEEMHHHAACSLRVRSAQAHGAEKVADLGARAQVCADAVPQVVERAHSLVARLHEAAAELERLPEALAQRIAVREQAARVQALVAEARD